MNHLRAKNVEIRPKTLPAIASPSPPTMKWHAMNMSVRSAKTKSVTKTADVRIAPTVKITLTMNQLQRNLRPDSGQIMLDEDDMMGKRKVKRVNSQ